MGVMNSEPFPMRAIDIGRCFLAPLEAGDAKALAPELAGMDPWATLGHGQRALATWMTREDPGLRRYAIRCGSQTAGIVGVRYPWLKGPYLELVAVLPAYQSTGIGSSALRWFDSEARKLGKNSWLLVSAFNEGARRFYERYGWSEAAVLPGLAAEEHAEVLMRKRY